MRYWILLANPISHTRFWFPFLKSGHPLKLLRLNMAPVSPLKILRTIFHFIHSSFPYFFTLFVFVCGNLFEWMNVTRLHAKRSFCSMPQQFIMNCKTFNCLFQNVFSIIYSLIHFCPVTLSLTLYSLLSISWNCHPTWIAWPEGFLFCFFYIHRANRNCL